MSCRKIINLILFSKKRNSHIGFLFTILFGSYGIKGDHAGSEASEGVIISLSL